MFSVEKGFRNCQRRSTDAINSVYGRMKKAKRVVESTRRDGICIRIVIKLSWTSYAGAVANCLILYQTGTHLLKTTCSEKGSLAHWSSNLGLV